MPQVTITHPDASADTIDRTLGYRYEREIGEMATLEIDVNRDDADGIAFDRKEDEVELDGVATQRLWDVEKDGSVWTLVCYSWERDGQREEPTPGGDKREGTDEELVTDLVTNGGPGSWTLGSTVELTGGMAFVFNHARPHEALRRVEKNVPGELAWRDDKSVDYVDELGDDKTGSVTLAPGNGTLEGGLEVIEQGREFDATHIRVIGAHEGEAQVYANLVPSLDSATYENRVDYDVGGRWSDGDTRDWGRWENKDVADQDTVEEEAAALGDDLDDELVEVRASVDASEVGGLSLGDWVRVEKPAADLDRDMRVHRIETILTDATTRHDVLLSTRSRVRDDDNRRIRDIQRFNTAFQGSSVSVQGGGSRQPVMPGINAEIPFDYPELAFENDAMLQVRGLPYRAYSSGAAAGAIDSDNTNPFDHSVTLTNDTSSSNSFDLPTVSGDGSSALVYVNVHYRTDNSSIGCATLSITNTSTGTTIYSDEFASTYQPGDSRMHELVQAGNVEGDTIEVEIVDGGCDGGDYRLSFGAWILSEHTHQPQPGVIEFAEETPTSVDVLVNGETVATDIGSGTFETEVDISGELNTNEWNMVELASGSIGHIQATVSIDGYKQIGAE